MSGWPFWSALALIAICIVCIFANAYRKAREDNPYSTGEAYDPFGYEFGDCPNIPDVSFHERKLP